MPPQFRRLVVARLMAGRPRRWIYYFVLTAGWRRFRKLTGREPETVYTTVLRRGELLDVAASPPLPRRLRTKQVRRALRASSSREAHAVARAAPSRRRLLRR